MLGPLLSLDFAHEWRRGHMAKNQSRKPGRDVRGGTGKRSRKPNPQTRPYKKDARRRGYVPAGKQKTARPGTTRANLIEGRRAVAEALDAGIPLKRALWSLARESVIVRLRN